MVTTGSMRVSAMDCNSANADEIIVPPPARMIGFSACNNISIALSTLTMSGSAQGWYPRILNSSGKSIGSLFVCTSFGMSISTGPGLPDSAIKNPFLTASGTAPAVLG